MWPAGIRAEARDGAIFNRGKREVPQLDQSHDGPSTPQEEATTRSTISYAGYGVWSSTSEVTTQIRKAAIGGTMVFLASNTLIGDPALRLNTIRNTAA